MKILNISSGQFAGVLNKVYPPEGSFSDGINIVYGPNESGKTTMVNLLSRLMFQSVNIDRRSDKEFVQQCFPTVKRTGHPGDFVDGTLSFQGEQGIYRLTKEWGKRSSCVLELPDHSKIADPAKISDILAKELLYSEGLFDSVIFPSQQGSDRALKVLLNASQKGNEKDIADTRQEILSVIQQAFVESGGASIEGLGAEIENQVSDLEGKHWDATQNVPKRNVSGARWSRDKGAILTAFYELEDAETKRCQIEALEHEIDQTRYEIGEIANKLTDTQEKQRAFDKFRGQLTARNANLDRKATLERDLKRMENIIRDWPKLQSDAAQAERLSTELDSSILLEKWQKVSALQVEIGSLQQEIVSNGSVSKEDNRKATQLAQKINHLQRQLTGLNLLAHINLLNGHELQVVSVSTGQPIPIENGSIHLTESARLTIPGVVEMILTPADIDLDNLEEELHEFQQALEDILQRYKVQSVSQLDDRFEQCEDLQRKKERLNLQLETMLDGTTLDELQACADHVPSNTRTKSGIQADIKALCGNTSANDFVSRKRALIDSYKKEFTSIVSLEQQISLAKKNLLKLEQLLEESEEIPQEYLDIQDPDSYANIIQADIQRLQEDRRRKDSSLGRMEERLDNLLDGADPIRDCEEKNRILENLKAELAHWKHIQTVFLNLKETLLTNPAGDLADRFEHYLSCISSGKVSTNMLSNDSLSLAVYSGEHRLTMDTLSEGTKDTVALAFRLAVLDYLYPDGGGLAVFDDPFTDMDAERKREACTLLKEFAQRHQVIFLTCSEEYSALLGGKQFEM
jgi:uncharacterized protein YhaN